MTALKRACSRAMVAIRRLVSGPDAERGAAALEFAVIAPTLVLATVCTVDLGLGLYQRMQVQNAAHAGAVYAATHGFSAADISNVVTSATKSTSIAAAPAPAQFCGCASNAGIADAACNTACPGGATSGNYIRVSAQTSYAPLLPYPLLPTPLDLSSQAVVRIN